MNWKQSKKRKIKDYCMCKEEEKKNERKKKVISFSFLLLHSNVPTFIFFIFFCLGWGHSLNVSCENWEVLGNVVRIWYATVVNHTPKYYWILFVTIDIEFWWDFLIDFCLQIKILWDIHPCYKNPPTHRSKMPTSLVAQITWRDKSYRSR